MAENEPAPTDVAPKEAAPAPTRSAKAAPSAPARPKRIQVDEERERAVAVGASTVIFRPREIISGLKLRIAEQHGILTREV